MHLFIKGGMKLDYQSVPLLLTAYKMLSRILFSCLNPDVSEITGDLHISSFISE
jgi:hypothetical protein